MRYTLIGILGALTFLPAFAQVSSGSLSEETTGKIIPRHFGPIRDKFDHGNGTAESSNWSGYAVEGSSFTKAEGSWVVPTATCSGVKGDQYAAFWVGLDGYNSDTVEQTGTDSDCDRTSPTYYAWYEFYPRASIEITTVPIHPGDLIYASVVYNSGESFTVTIYDKTTEKYFTKTGTVRGADRSSAEWITEAPCCTAGGGILPLADFGTVLFGKDSSGIAGTNFATDSSTTGAIGSFPAVDTIEINKTSSSSSPQTSACSALSTDGTSFSCTWAQ